MRAAGGLKLFHSRLHCAADLKVRLKLSLDPGAQLADGVVIA